MKLLALLCPECSHPLKPENDHIVVACEFCHAAVQIGDEGLSLVPVQVARPRTGAKVTLWLPFWVFYGRVQVKRRQVASGDRSGREEMAHLWGEPRYLYVPAWELPQSTVRDTSSKMIQRQPAYQAITKPADAHLTPVILTKEDALKVLELVIVTIEARRLDWLEHLDFQLEVGEPMLWALPADDQGIVALESTT